VTPQQALALLNDPVFAECAAALGRRIARESDPARFAFRLCLAREPNEVERKVLAEAYEAHRKLAGEEAAWAAVGRVLLNTDEFITRE
jgi:hypothetical protein